MSQGAIAIAHQSEIAERVFVVDPKRCVSKPERTFNEVFSDLIWWKLQIILTVLPKSFRYVAEHSAEWR